MEIGGIRSEVAMAGLKAAQGNQLSVLNAVSANLENVKAVTSVAAAGARPKAPTASGVGALIDISV
jgi:hypothetical protein